MVRSSSLTRPISWLSTRDDLLGHCEKRLYNAGGLTMWRDPIVEEVCKAGEQLARQANYDLHTFFQNLRNNEKKRKAKVVSRVVNKAKYLKTPEIE